MLTANLYAFAAFGSRLSAPLVMLVATRPRSDTGRASAALCVKVCASVIVGVLAARFVAVPWLESL